MTRLLLRLFRVVMQDLITPAVEASVPPVSRREAQAIVANGGTRNPHVDR